MQLLCLSVGRFFQFVIHVLPSAPVVHNWLLSIRGIETSPGPAFSLSISASSPLTAFWLSVSHLQLGEKFDKKLPTPSWCGLVTEATDFCKPSLKKMIVVNLASNSCGLFKVTFKLLRYELYLSTVSDVRNLEDCYQKPREETALI